jgi:hypothetical protein
MKKQSLTIILCILFTLPNLWAREKTPVPVSGRDPGIREELKPADVLSRAKLLGLELEVLRQYMGQDISATDVIIVENAQPAEVYYQARVLLDRANSFAKEMRCIEVQMP